MENSKTKIISDTNSSHLIMDSIPESPSDITSNSSSLELHTKSQVNSPAQLSFTSSPETSPSSPEKSPVRSPVMAPVHFDTNPISEIPSNIKSDEIYTPPLPEKSPENSPVKTPEHLAINPIVESHISPLENSPELTPLRLTINSIPEIPSRPYNNRTKPLSPSENSPERPSISSGHITLSNVSSPQEEKVAESLPEKEPVAPKKTVSDGRRKKLPLSVLRRANREKIVKRVALGFRVFGSLFCMISFSVMAANTNKGWALDSFHHYKEFRYSISVNIIAFIYSTAQAFDLAYYLATGKSFVQHPFRSYFDFVIDQMITYLLISSSSSASTRIDDWKLNWGKDKFPDMATSSVSIAFLAFLCLAFSSLISGYKLCNSKSL